MINAILRVFALFLAMLTILSISGCTVAEEVQFHNEAGEYETPDVQSNESRHINQHIIGKVLFVADSVSENITYDDSLVDFRIRNELDKQDAFCYEAVALPYSNEAFHSLAKELYRSGVRVYLYGNLTIDDYKSVIGIDRFALDTNVYAPEGYICDTVSQGFDSAFESSEVFSVISYGNHALLGGTADPMHTTMNTYMRMIISNFKQCHDDRSLDEMIHSKFDHVRYWGPNDAFEIRLDYQVFRNLGEQDPEYNYFGVKTRTWCDCNLGYIIGIDTGCDFPSNEFNLVEHVPSTQSKVGDLSVSAGCGGAGPSAAIRFNMNLEAIKPDIKCDANYTTDTIHWSMTPRFTSNLNDASLHCCATWAEPSQESECKVTLSYGGIAAIDGAPEVHHHIESKTFQLPIICS